MSDFANTVADVQNADNPLVGLKEDEVKEEAPPKDRAKPKEGQAFSRVFTLYVPPEGTTTGEFLEKERKEYNKIIADCINGKFMLRQDNEIVLRSGTILASVKWLKMDDAPKTKPEQQFLASRLQQMSQDLTSKK